MSAYAGDPQQFGSGLQQVVQQDQSYGGKEPEETAVVEVTIELATGGRRVVSLPVSEVRGRTPGQVFEAALNRIGLGQGEGGGERGSLQGMHNAAWVRNVSHLVRQPEAGIEMYIDGAAFSLPAANSQVPVRATATIRFEVGLDETGGMTPWPVTAADK